MHKITRSSKQFNVLKTKYGTSLDITLHVLLCLCHEKKKHANLP